LLAVVARRQWHSRLEALQFDPGARTSPQQPVCRFAQSSTTLGRVMSKGGVESREKCCDVTLYPFTQGLVDERPTVFGKLRLGDQPESRVVFPLLTWLAKTLEASRGTRCAELGGLAGPMPAVRLWIRCRCVRAVGQPQM